MRGKSPNKSQDAHRDKSRIQCLFESDDKFRHESHDVRREKICKKSC